MRKISVLLGLSLIALASVSSASAAEAPPAIQKEATVSIVVTNKQTNTLVTTGLLSVLVNDGALVGNLAKPVPLSVTRQYTYTKSSTLILETDEQGLAQTKVVLTPGTVSEGFDASLSFKQAADQTVSGRLDISIARLLKFKTIKSGKQSIQLPEVENFETIMDLKEGNQTKAFGPYTADITVKIHDVPSKKVEVAQVASP